MVFHAMPGEGPWLPVRPERFQRQGRTGADHDTGEELRDSTRKRRHLAAKAPKIQRAAGQTANTRDGTEHVGQVRPAAQRREPQDQQHPGEPEQQPKDLRRAQTLSQKRPREQRAKQRVQCLNKGDRSRLDAAHGDMGGHQQDRLRRHPDHRAMHPTRERQRSCAAKPGAAERGHRSGHDRGRQDHPQRNEPQRRHVA